MDPKQPSPSALFLWPARLLLAGGLLHVMFLTVVLYPLLMGLMWMKEVDLLRLPSLTQHVPILLKIPSSVEPVLLLPLLPFIGAVLIVLFSVPSTVTTLYGRLEVGVLLRMFHRTLGRCFRTLMVMWKNLLAVLVAPLVCFVATDLCLTYSEHSAALASAFLGVIFLVQALPYLLTPLYSAALNIEAYQALQMSFHHSRGRIVESALIALVSLFVGVTGYYLASHLGVDQHLSLAIAALVGCYWLFSSLAHRVALTLRRAR